MSLYAMTPGNYKSKSIKRLIVDNVERYRLEIDNKLVYAKAKIILDLNLPVVDGRELLKYAFHNIPEELYVFYNDGFYYGFKGWGGVETDRFGKYDIEKLSDFFYKDPWHNLHTAPGQHRWNEELIDFNGWTTEKEDIEFENQSRLSSPKGIKVDTMASLKNLVFNYREDNEMPTITLYAHWKVPKYSIRINVITKKKRSSSYVYNGKTLTESTTFYAKYGTNISNYIKRYISDVKYVTWATKELDGTKWQNKLRAGPQTFRGWYDTKLTDYNVVGFEIIQPKTILTRNISVAPIFDILVIYPKIKKPDGGMFNGMMVLLNPIETDDNPNATYPNQWTYVDMNNLCMHSDFIPIYGGGWDLWYTYDEVRYAWRPKSTKSDSGASLNHNYIKPGSTIVMEFKKIS